MNIDISNTKIGDLFENKFFTKLENFIFGKDFDTFLNEYLKKNQCTIQDIQYALHDPNRKDEKPNYKTIDIKSFNKFVYHANNTPLFAFDISMKIFSILHMIKKINSEEIKNTHFRINLSIESILTDFYQKEIIYKLCNSTYNDLCQSIREKNKFIFFKNADDINTIMNNVLLFVFDYILVYINTLYKDINQDILQLIKIYKYETKYQLNDSLNEELSKDILKTIKELKLNKYKKKQGRNKRRIPNIDKIEFLLLYDKAKKILNTYKKGIDKIIKKNVDKKQAKEELSSYINDTNDKDIDYMHSMLFYIYFNLKINNPESSPTEMVIYKFLDMEYNLNFFDINDESKDILAYENMHKWIKRNF